MDFAFEFEADVLLLEYDEQMHADREKRCELVRQAEVSMGYGGMPVHWIRYNPDKFKNGGVLQAVASKERESVLLKLIQNAVSNPDYENLITVNYLCYDKPAGADFVESFKFKTIEDYSAWVDSVAPEKLTSSGSGGSRQSTCSASKKFPHKWKSENEICAVPCPLP